MTAALLPVIVKSFVFTLTVGPEYVPGLTTIVSPGAASSTAVWIALVLPLGATRIFLPCAVDGTTHPTAIASATASSLSALRWLRTMIISSMRFVRMALVHGHARNTNKRYQVVLPGQGHA